MKILRFIWLPVQGHRPVRVSVRNCYQLSVQNDLVTLWLISTSEEVETWYSIEGRKFIRAVAAMSTGFCAGVIDIEYENSGRPILIGAENLPDISISHSQNYLAIALGRGVGVDVEILRGRARHEDFARFAIACGDSCHLAHITSQDEFDLLRLWTTKEACLKSAGTGIGGSFGHSGSNGQCWCTGDRRTVSFVPFRGVVLALSASISF